MLNNNLTNDTSITHTGKPINENIKYINKGLPPYKMPLKRYITYPEINICNMNINHPNAHNASKDDVTPLFSTSL